MVTEAWGAFVVRCMPLIRREAERLARRGVPLDIEDAVQDVATALLGDGGETSAENIRARVRSRLIDVHRKAVRAKRGGGKKSVERIPDSIAFDGLPFVASPEDAVIEKVDAEKLLDLWPKTTGGREAAKQMRDRWLPAFQEFATRGAA